MASIGSENEKKIKTITSEPDRWKFIYEISKTYGFEGIHVGTRVGADAYINEFNLNLNNIPDYYEDLKFTFHLGTAWEANFIDEKDCKAFDKTLENIFKIAENHNIHDISFHPPGKVNGYTSYERKKCEENLDKAISKWIGKAIRTNISLSLETHVTNNIFLFEGLEEFVKFSDKHPNLGILIDISHNYYDNYSEDDIINIVGNKNVKGLHISDALQNSEIRDIPNLRKCTHLAVGDGTVDFSKLLNHFRDVPNLYGALEINKSNGEIQESLNELKNLIIDCI